MSDSDIDSSDFDTKKRGPSKKAINESSGAVYKAPRSNPVTYEDKHEKKKEQKD